MYHHTPSSYDIKMINLCKNSDPQSKTVGWRGAKGALGGGGLLSSFSFTEVRPALRSDSFPDLLQLFHILSHPINLLYIEFLLESVSWRTQAKRYGASSGPALWDHLFTASWAHLMICRIWHWWSGNPIAKEFTVGALGNCYRHGKCPFKHNDSGIQKCER